jgi:hypothetical protein
MYSKKYVACFYDAQHGGMFTNSSTPFSLAGASHALEVRHCRGDLTLGRIILAGSNEATTDARRRECERWVTNRNPQEGDVFQLYDVNMKVRYGVILCVGEKRGRYDN